LSRCVRRVCGGGSRSADMKYGLHQTHTHTRMVTEAGEGGMVL